MAETPEESPIWRHLRVPDWWLHSSEEDLGSSEEDLGSSEPKARYWRLESQAHFPSPVVNPAQGPPPRWSLKGPAGWGGGGGASRGAEPGPCLGGLRTGLGRRWRWPWRGSRRRPAQGEGGQCEPSCCLRGLCSGPPGEAAQTAPLAGRVQPPRAGRGRGSGQRPGGVGFYPRPPGPRARAFLVAVEGKAGLLAPPWEIHHPFVPAGPPPSWGRESALR